MFKRVLNDAEKERCSEVVAKSTLNSDRFLWEEWRSGLLIRSALVYKPGRYFFLCDREKSKIVAKEYFPNWGYWPEVGEKYVLETLEDQLLHWIGSIVRTFERQKELFVPVEKGSTRRRNFARVAKVVCTGKQH